MSNDQQIVEACIRQDRVAQRKLYELVVNTALKVLQKNAQMKWVDIAGQYDLEDRNQQNLGLENMKMETLLGMVNELPEGSRMIFNLYTIEGYKHQEIAEMLDINEGTSKSQYARAKTLLSEKIEKENNRLAKSRSEYERGF
ncbi:MAG: hypothetical protein IPH28_22385 [Cytophagaceae bacterium]|nr:hypothetical protein [Cytophagaceae bacterium]